MSYVKTPIYGNHLGIVINDASSDPEQRGRVQIWIPYLTNTLHTNWNDKLEDKQFKHIHDSGALSPELLEELRNVLPWSECASPIMGGGTSATYNSTTGITDTNPHRTFQSGNVDFSGTFSETEIQQLADKSVGLKNLNWSDQRIYRDAVGISNPDRKLIPDVEKRLLAFDTLVRERTNGRVVPVYTSSTGGSHSPNSLHYSGQAIDVRFPANDSDVEIMVDALAELGGNEIIIHAPSGKNSPNGHLHMGFGKKIPTAKNEWKNGRFSFFNDFKKNFDNGSYSSDQITKRATDIAEIPGQSYNSSKTATSVDFAPVDSSGAEGIINKKFAGSKLDGLGKSFVDAGQKYNVDPYLLASIASFETGNGSFKGAPSYLNANNIGGQMQKNDPSKPIQFNSFEESIFNKARSLSKNYDLTNTSTIGSKYAPVGASNDPNGTNYLWSSTVNNIYSGMTGKSYGTGSPTTPSVNPIPNFNSYTSSAGLAGDQPSGFISTPKIGAKVFVFFLAGDIQKPIYFASLMEKESYQKSMSVASPGIEDTGATGVASFESLNGAGGSVSFNGNYRSINDVPTNNSSVEVMSKDGGGVNIGAELSFFSPAGTRMISMGDITETGFSLTKNIGFDSIYNTGNTIISCGLNGTKEENEKKLKSQEKINDTLKEIQNNKIKEIENNAKNGEKVPCPLCSTSHAVDRASKFAKRITQIIRNHVPYLSYMVDVLQFLTTVLVVPFCSIVPGSALGDCGNPECENGMIPSPQKPIEDANKKAAEKLVSKQKEINELEKELGSGGCYSVMALKDVVISAGGSINDANCYAKTTNKPIPIGGQTQSNNGSNQTVRHLCSKNCKNTPYTPPLQYPGGNILLKGGNAVKIIAGSPGIELNTKGKISLNCGSIEILSSDGEIMLGSKNHTTLSGKVVTISANDRTKEGGVQIDSPHMICQGFTSTGNAAIKGGVRIDGELSIPYLNTVSQRMQCDNADIPTQRGGFSNWAIGSAQQNDIANKTRTAITHYAMPGALLMISNIIKFIMQIFNTILINTVIEPRTTGFGVGYGYVQMFNWHHNSMQEPNPHHHDYILPKGTYYDDIAGVNDSAVEPSDVPSRARKNGMGPEGGPKSLAGCGGFGGWGGGSGGRRGRYNRTNSFGLNPDITGFVGTPLSKNNTTYKYNPDGTIDLTINDTPC